MVASSDPSAPGTANTAVVTADDAPASSRRTLVEWFGVQVETRGSEPALYFRSAGRYLPITWSDFATASKRLSAYLLDQGVGEHEHVAIWSNNRPEWHIADMAVLSLRCRPVPVYLTLSAEQGGYVLNHSESRVVIVENAGILDRVLARRSELPHLRRIIVIDGLDKPSDDGFVVAWESILQRGDELLAQAEIAKAIDERRRAVDFDDVATLIYTSGTTGPPKAVTLTHANAAATADAITSFMTSGPDERVLSYLPLAHVAERIVSEFRSYMYGNATYFLDGIPNLGERLKEVRPTVFFGVPRIWEKMETTVKNRISEASPLRRGLANWAIRVGMRVADDREKGRTTGPWLRRRHAIADKLVLTTLREALGLDKARILATGAAPISPEVLLFFRAMGLEICEVYGQTEDCAMTTMNRPGETRPGTVGVRLPGIEVNLAEDGEILVRGGNVFHGYYKDDAATSETLIDGWLHTGDVGEFDGDGYLRITDRKKDLIITAGGKNIAPSNIEGLLKRLPMIANAVAIGDRRPFVSALLTLDPEEAQRFSDRAGISGDLAQLADDPRIAEAVAAHVKLINAQLSQVEQVKKWKILPADFTMGDELTPSLKVKRKVVAEKYASEIEALYTR